MYYRRVRGGVGADHDKGRQSGLGCGWNTFRFSGDRVGIKRICTLRRFIDRLALHYEANTSVGRLPVSVDDFRYRSDRRFDLFLGAAVMVRRARLDGYNRWHMYFGVRT